MSNIYVLVNPHIGGEYNNSIKANNSVNAAKEFYTNLSEHFNNAVPKFYFTIQKGGSGKGKYYHFEVAEKRNKNNVSFTLKSHNIDGGANINGFSERLDKIKSKILQAGGKNKNKKNKSKKHKKHDDSESDSESDISSSSDNYKRLNTYIPVTTQPIYYYWYDPSIYRLESYYIPTFYSYITPLIEVVFNN